MGTTTGRPCGQVGAHGIASSASSSARCSRGSSASPLRRAAWQASVASTRSAGAERAQRGRRRARGRRGELVRERAQQAGGVALAEQRGHGAQRDRVLAERRRSRSRAPRRARVWLASAASGSGASSTDERHEQALARDALAPADWRAAARRARARAPRADRRAAARPCPRAAGRSPRAVRAARSRRAGKATLPSPAAVRRPPRRRALRRRATRRAARRRSSPWCARSSWRARRGQVVARRTVSSAAPDAAAPSQLRRASAPCSPRRTSGGSPRGSAKRTSHFAGWTFTSTAPGGSSRNSTAVGMPPARQHVAVELVQRVLHHAIAHGPPLHEEVDAGGGGAVVIRARGEAVDAQRALGVIERDERGGLGFSPARPRADRAASAAGQLALGRSSRARSKWTSGSASAARASQSAM